MLRRSPAKVGLPRARLWTGDHITPGDLVCPTKSIPSFHRQERRELPPTRGLAGSGSRLRRLQKSTNGPRSPVPWSLTEWALPPPGCTDSSSAEMRLEQACRRHTAARETTLRRRRRLELNQRRVDDAERAERETSAELMSAEWAAGQHARARDSVAVATFPSPVRAQPVHSRSDRLGDEAFMDSSVSFMASAGRHEFTTEMRTAVVRKASALLTSVRRSSFQSPELLSVRCLLYTSPSPRDQRGSRMPSSA